MKKFKDLGINDVLFEVSTKDYQDKDRDSGLYNIEEKPFWGFGNSTKEEKKIILIHFKEPSNYDAKPLELNPEESNYENRYFTEISLAEKFVKGKLIEKINELQEDIKLTHSKIENIRKYNYKLLNPSIKQ